MERRTVVRDPGAKCSFAGNRWLTESSTMRRANISSAGCMAGIRTKRWEQQIYSSLSRNPDDSKALRTAHVRFAGLLRKGMIRA